MQYIYKTQSTLDWYTHWRTGHNSATWIEACTAKRKAKHFYYLYTYIIFYDIKCFNHILIVRFKNLYSCTFYAQLTSTTKLLLAEYPNNNSFAVTTVFFFFKYNILFSLKTVHLYRNTLEMLL